MLQRDAVVVDVVVVVLPYRTWTVRVRVGVKHGCGVDHPSDSFLPEFDRSRGSQTSTLAALDPVRT